MTTKETTKKPQAPIFRVLKYITLDKKPWSELDDEEKEICNPWLLNKYLSMNEDYCEAVNFIQKNTWQMKGEHLYKIYLSIIPKKYVFLKYIKNTDKKEYVLEEINALSQYYELSTREIKEYMNILDNDFIKDITQQINGK